jgi:hypothetical protein
LINGHTTVAVLVCGETALGVMDRALGFNRICCLTPNSLELLVVFNVPDISIWSIWDKLVTEYVGANVGCIDFLCTEGVVISCSACGRCSVEGRTW